MSQSPEQDQGVNFGNRLIYDHNEFAERVMWPLLAEHVDNWRETSYGGDVFQFPAHGQHKGSFIDVLLFAHCMRNKDDDPPRLHSVGMEIKEAVVGDGRHVLLKAARKMVLESIENGTDIEKLPSGKARGVVAKKVRTYSFCTDGEFTIGSHGLVLSRTHNITVPPTLTDAEGARYNRLQPRDIQAIKAWR